jgi:cytochrome c
LLCLSASWAVTGWAQNTATNTVTATTATSKAMQDASIQGARFLVFTKTAGWRHDSIPAALEALKELADKHRFTIVHSEDAALFTEAQLRKYNAVVFLSTTGNILEPAQERAMEGYIRAGGGFVGIHSATDTERDGAWPWYGKLVGAVFKNHPNNPNVIEATVNVVHAKHPATESLPPSMRLRDEWYNFSEISKDNKVLVTVDEKTYAGGEHGDLHPISWYKEFEGGRSFYTALGHSASQYSLPEFADHLLGGMRYVVGANNQTPGQPALK